MKMGWLVGLGAGVATVLGIRYLFRMNRLQEEIEPVVRASIYKVTATGIIAQVNMVLKNPTAGQISMKFPFVKLMHNQSTVGSSQVIDKDILIPKFGEAVVDNVLVEIPWTSLVMSAISLYKNYEAGKPLEAQVKVISTVKMAWGNQPYERIVPITIKVPTQQAG